MSSPLRHPYTRSTIRWAIIGALVGTVLSVLRLLLLLAGSQSPQMSLVVGWIPATVLAGHGIVGACAAWTDQQVRSGIRAGMWAAAGAQAIAGAIEGVAILLQPGRFTPLTGFPPPDARGILLFATVGLAGSVVLAAIIGNLCGAAGGFLAFLMRHLFGQQGVWS